MNELYAVGKNIVFTCIIFTYNKSHYFLGRTHLQFIEHTGVVRFYHWIDPCIMLTLFVRRIFYMAYSQ